jgi:hypothetical protein
MVIYYSLTKDGDKTHPLLHTSIFSRFVHNKDTGEGHKVTMPNRAKIMPNEAKFQLWSVFSSSIVGVSVSRVGRISSYFPPDQRRPLLLGGTAVLGRRNGRTWSEQRPHLVTRKGLRR